MSSHTPATIASYRAFLQQKYRNDIGLLNQAWQTSLGSFGDVAGQPATPEIVTVGGEAAEWYDWSSFNNARVTAMYTMIAETIHEEAAKDPHFHQGCNTTTLKLQDGNEFTGLRYKGIDREALVDALTWNGCDSGIASNAGLNSRARVNAKCRVANPEPNLANPPGGTWGGAGWLQLYDKNRYCADWLGQGAGYTLQRSLSPSKPLYDTEWHSVGTLTWRDEEMTREYASTAVWFTLFHGLAINVAWYL